MGSTLRILLLLGILTGCIHISEGITSDCTYFFTLARFLPSFIGDLISCIGDPRSNVISAGFNPGNFMCIIKCTLMKGGMLEEDGGVDVVGALELLGTLLPTEIKHKGEDVVTSCQDTLGSIDLENDPQCLTYLPLLTCAIPNMIQVFLDAIVNIMTGKQQIDFMKLFTCFLTYQGEPANGENGDEANEAEPAGDDGQEAKRQRVNPFNFYSFVNSTNYNGYGNSTTNGLNNLNNTFQLALRNLTNIATQFMRLFVQSTSQFSQFGQPRNIKKVVRT